METVRTGSEFEISKFYSRESLLLSNGFFASLLLCLGSASFIKAQPLGYILTVIFGILALGLLLARFLILQKSDRLIIEDDLLRHASGELRADEIDKVLLADSTLTIKRKNRRWSHVSFQLKHHLEFDALKDRVSAFAGRHNIKIEIVKQSKHWGPDPGGREPS
jgi:hypothetical protein